MNTNCEKKSQSSERTKIEKKTDLKNKICYLFVIVLALGTIIFSPAMWITVILSFLLFVGIFFVLFFSKKENVTDEEVSEQNQNVIEELKLEIQRLEKDKGSLYHQLDILKNIIEQKNNDFIKKEEELKFEIQRLEKDNESLRRQLDTLKNIVKQQSARERQLVVTNNNVIQKEYEPVFILLQRLDTWLDYLPSAVKSYVEAMKDSISMLLTSYGLKFLDLTTDKLDYYDYERGPIEEPEVPRKAIITEDGKLVIKGMAHIPNNYGLINKDTHIN